MKQLWKDADQAREQVETEMLEYEQLKDEQSMLRRKNLVLWKHIKKIRKRAKRSAKQKRNGKSPSPDGRLSEDDENDPDLDHLLE